MSIFQPRHRREFLSQRPYLCRPGPGDADVSDAGGPGAGRRLPLALNLPPIPGGKILVVIEMSGGNDGLNTVIPYTDPGYAKARPVIGIPANDVVKTQRSTLACTRT